MKNFDRADKRRLASEQKERLTRMFAALSATNEAIMRAGTRAELFDLVCEAAVQGGRFASTIIGLSEAAATSCASSPGPARRERCRGRCGWRSRTTCPEGRGISGTAYRTLQPCIINDYLANSRGAAFHKRALLEGNQAGAALPLVSHG